MRIILMGIQIGLLSLLIAVSMSIGGGLVAWTAMPMGYGPAAMAGGLYILTAIVAALAGFVVVIAPLCLLAAMTLVCAFLAGFRPLRWMRWGGVLANLLAGVAIAAPKFFITQYPIGMMAFLGVYPLVNTVLFALLPRRPDVKTTRRVCAIAIPGLYLLVVVGMLLLVCAGRPDWNGTAYAVLAVFILLCGYPFYYAWRTVPGTERPDWRLVRRLAILTAMTALLLLVFFPIGLPLALGWYLLAALAEISLLYPQWMPPNGGARYWIARVLGVPSEPTPASPEPFPAPR